MTTELEETLAHCEDEDQLFRWALRFLAGQDPEEAARITREERRRDEEDETR